MNFYLLIKIIWTRLTKTYKSDFRIHLSFLIIISTKFISLVRKVVYRYEYIDDWEKFNEISLPKYVDFYSNLCIDDITDTDYNHAKRVSKDFEIKNLGEYHDLYFISNTLLLADVFENFRKICLEI